MDRQRIEEFLDRFIEMASSATTIGLLAVADRSGLSADLGQHGGGTAGEIAERAGLEERYVVEILSGLAAAGIVEYEAENGTFILPPEHALFLADQTSPYFMGGWLDMIPLMMEHLAGVAHAVEQGGGVSFEEFGEGIIGAIDRANAPSYRVFLTSRWLPGVPGLAERLESGINVADIGCGEGTAAALMAQAYPRCEVFGFDLSEESIARARDRAPGLPNLEFHVADVSEIPLEPGFDLVTAFDVVHDLPDPLAALRRVSRAMRQDGAFLMMEPNLASPLEDNLHPRGALMYGVSTLHCLTQSLARGGAGLGAAWGREQAEDLVREAGFTTFQPLEEISNRFSAFYLLRP